MKSLFFFLATTLILCCASFACADRYTDDLYAKFFGGADFLQTESSRGVKPVFETGYLISGAVGYRQCDGWNMEMEYAFRRNSMKKLHYFGQDFKIPGSFESSSYMANLLWNFSIAECFLGSFQPFLGGGIGYDVQQFHAHEDGFSITYDKKGFAWQLMAGLNYPLLNTVETTLEYRFHKGPLQHFFSHAIGVSFIYKFVWQCY